MADNQCVGQIECDSQAARGDTILTVPTVSPTRADRLVRGDLVRPGRHGCARPDTPPPPPPTTPATTTTSCRTRPYFAVGESVMLGAKPVLDARGIKTVAEVSKGPTWELEQLQLGQDAVPVHPWRRHPAGHQRRGDAGRVRGHARPTHRCATRRHDDRQGPQTVDRRQQRDHSFVARDASQRRGARLAGTRRGDLRASVEQSTVASTSATTPPSSSTWT